MSELSGRSARKRASILAAARELFLVSGFGGASVDAVAASAQVSKQTVYKHFGDKHELLVAIVDEALETTVTDFLQRVSTLAGTDDLDRDLEQLGRDYLHAVLADPVVQLRRLVVGEANRLPDFAAQYYRRAPARMLAAFAECFTRLDRRGLLRVDEPDAAADHFAFLMVGRCIDEALFHGGPQVLAALDVDRHVTAAVRVFLAAYRP